MHNTLTNVHSYVCSCGRTRSCVAFDVVLTSFVASGGFKPPRCLYSYICACMCVAVCGVGGRDLDIITLRRHKGSFRVTYLSATHLCRYFYTFGRHCHRFDINLPLKSRTGTGLKCGFFSCVSLFFIKIVHYIV